jgi:hypothetical protein
MTTEKQITANQINAQLSTGPTTVSGKLTISTNAIKHGIFTKDLILTSKTESENKDEYQELLQNLIACLCPSNQVESLLVEKIAMDFWRLRRVIRFETGSIARNIQSLCEEFYSDERKSDEEIYREIEYKHLKLFYEVYRLEK